MKGKCWDRSQYRGDTNLHNCYELLILIAIKVDMVEDSFWEGFQERI